MIINSIGDVLDTLFRRGQNIYVTREKYDQILMCLRIVETEKEADRLNIVREERERIQEIVAKWMESSNPAYAQDLFEALTPTKTDKQDV